MRKIIGNEIFVFLKTSSGDVWDFSGLLIDVTEESLYIRGDISDSRIYIVPRNNVDYCITDEMPSAERTVVAKNSQPESIVAEQSQQPSTLEVYINKEKVTSIPVPPTFNLMAWHDGIMRVIMGNPDVKSLLAGKKQKSLEYYPGEVYIDIEDGYAPESCPNSTDTPNTFVMGEGGDPATDFMNPLQMVTRLQNTTKEKGKKDENKET